MILGGDWQTNPSMDSSTDENKNRTRPWFSQNNDVGLTKWRMGWLERKSNQQQQRVTRNGQDPRTVTPERNSGTLGFSFLLHSV